VHHLPPPYLYLPHKPTQPIQLLVPVGPYCCYLGTDDTSEPVRDAEDMSSDKQLPIRERRPSVGAPVVDVHGSVVPAGISRPKHKRTLTGFGAGEIKHVEGMNTPYDVLFVLFYLISMDAMGSSSSPNLNHPIRWKPPLIALNAGSPSCCTALYLCTQ
jgi:hypothetical protein